MLVGDGDAADDGADDPARLDREPVAGEQAGEQTADEAFLGTDGQQSKSGLSDEDVVDDALVGLSETMRLELRPRGIHVHLVCPPEFDSPMVDWVETLRSARALGARTIIPGHGNVQHDAAYLDAVIELLQSKEMIK